MENGIEAWAISLAKYVKEVVTLFKERLAWEGYRPLARKLPPPPFAVGYRP